MMRNSRDSILEKLQNAQRSMPPHPPVETHLPMVPSADISPKTYEEQFSEQAQKLGCVIHSAGSHEEALAILMELIGIDQLILSWPFNAIPLAGLAETLQTHGIEIAAPRDPWVRIGLTGVDAAFAATGSLVLSTDRGKHRAASLLPPIHVAVLRRDQIVADLETWIARQRTAGVGHFRAVSSTMIISGPSRTADIAMQLVMGMHGPRELIIILVD